MLYDTPGQEDEDSALRFRKITKDEYDDVLRLVNRLWEQKKSDSLPSKLWMLTLDAQILLV